MANSQAQCHTCPPTHTPCHHHHHHHTHARSHFFFYTCTHVHMYTCTHAHTHTHNTRARVRTLMPPNPASRLPGGSWPRLAVPLHGTACGLCFTTTRPWSSYVHVLRWVHWFPAWFAQFRIAVKCARDVRGRMHVHAEHCLGNRVCRGHAQTIMITLSGPVLGLTKSVSMPGGNAAPRPDAGAQRRGWRVGLTERAVGVRLTL